MSNLAGTTVEVSKGKVKINEVDHHVIDLPGTYSIYPSSFEEKVGIDYLLSNKADIDLLVYVADANQLFRNLLFFSQLSGLDIPMLLLVNMWDTEDFSTKIDLNNLNSELGVQVIAYSAKEYKTFPKLTEVLQNAFEHPAKSRYFLQDKSQESLLVQENEGQKVERSNHTIFLYKKISKLWEYYGKVFFQNKESSGAITKIVPFTKNILLLKD